MNTSHRTLLAVAAALWAAGCGSGPIEPNETAPEAPVATEQVASPLEASFEQAAAEYQVPVGLLKSIAYVETRVMDHAGSPSVTGGRGLMSLTRREGWDLLGRAAQLTGVDARRLELDAKANIRGAAAVLRELADRSFAQDASLSPSNPADYYHAVSLYPGIESPAMAHQYAAEVYGALETGFSAERPDGVVLQAPTFTEWAQRAPPEVNRDGLKQYPGAAQWVASPNYRAGRSSYTNIIIHDTEGSYSGTISWFQQTRSQVSAHYVVRSSDGQVTQMVENQNTAWHASCYNGRAIGIEHEGYAKDPTRWFTTAMYTSSAKLTRWLADRYSIPLTRSRIIGHGEVPLSCNASRHYDPGSGWNWTKYMQLVTGTAPTPTTGKLMGAVYYGGDINKRLSGATVTVAGKTVTTAADGLFTFVLNPGSYTATISKSGYGTASTTRTVVANTTVWGSTEINPVAAKGVLRGKIFVFNPANPTDQSKIIVGATVKAGTATMASDATGSYLFNLAPGTYTVSATKAGYETRSQARAVTASTTVWGSLWLPAAGTADLVPPAVEISFPADGSEMDLAELELRGTASDNSGMVKSLTVALNGGAAAAIALSGVDYKQIIRLKPGLNTIVVTAKDAAGKITTTTSKVTFNAGVAGDVHVQDDPESRLAGVTLTLKDPTTGKVVETTTSDADGVFGLTVAKVDADYVLVAKAAGYLTYAETVTVPSDRRLSVTLGLVPGDDAPVELGLSFDDIEDGATVTAEAVTLYGAVQGMELVAIEINGVQGETFPAGHFAVTVPLKEGVNHLEAVAHGAGGESITARLTLTRGGGGEKNSSGGCNAVPGFELFGLLALGPVLRRLRRRQR